MLRCTRFSEFTTAAFLRKERGNASIFIVLVAFCQSFALSIRINVAKAFPGVQTVRPGFIQNSQEP